MESADGTCAGGQDPLHETYLYVNFQANLACWQAVGDPLVIHMYRGTAIGHASFVQTNELNKRDSQTIQFMLVSKYSRHKD